MVRGEAVDRSNVFQRLKHNHEGFAFVPWGRLSRALPYFRYALSLDRRFADTEGKSYVVQVLPAQR